MFSIVCLGILIIYLLVWIIPKDIYLDIWNILKKYKKYGILIILLIAALGVNKKYICMAYNIVKIQDVRLYLFFIPLVYIVLYIVLYRGKKRNISFLNIKKAYYILVLITDILIIYNIDFATFKVNNFIGIPDELFISGLISIIVFITALMLDMLILSGATIKEINFAGTTFVKEDVKSSMEENETNMNMLVNKIDAEHNVLQRFEEYMLNANIAEKLRIQYELFDWNEEFRGLAQFYCESQKVQIDAECISADNFASIKNQLIVRYDISNTKANRVYKSLEANNSYFIAGEEALLFIPYESYYTDRLVVVLRGHGGIFEIEQRFILNIFKRFEDYVIPIIAELPMTE